MRNITGKSIVLTCVLALGAASLLGAGAVNTSGTWKLNAEKSDYGKRPKPKDVTVKIEHKEPSLKYTVTGTDGQGKPLNIQFSGAIDGKDYPITGAPNNVAKVSAKRVNDTTTESVGKSADGKVVETVTLTISPDGKTFTRVAKVKGPDGEFTLKSVYDKQ
jgi:hypothetical protein